MVIFNTATREKQKLVPIKKDQVSIYVCGPTVYNLIHLGNARALCVFDTLRRYLEYKGYKVKYVQNFTDVDDKIIKKANEEGKAPSDVSENAIKEYFIDARGLNVRDADIHPKVTENMDNILAVIDELVKKGFAYEADGDVYFDTTKYPDYGKLSHMPLEDLQAGARIEIGDKKHNPMDFAVWKAAKEGEPYWDSPYGKGRPGWHIECSAMSKHYIGDTIDIHGGGSDLIFPHHENEIAQSHCATGKTLANIWMHNGMLNIDNKKMSKSKNNFFLVRQVAEIYGYEAIRFLLLQVHYRSQLNYTAEVMDSCKAAVQRLYNCKENLERRLKNADISAPASEEVCKMLEFKVQEFNACLDDDFNTADAISIVFELVREANIYCADEASSPSDIKAIYDVFLKLNSVLGFLYEKKEEKIPSQVNELVEQRALARKNKDFKLADEIRDKIFELGFTVKETRQGTIIEKI
ncbi:MAG: cysteine--tRNA ligase [Clostridiales bacterium]|mgnify:CR=1 FL=1|nr:cysteine--tRNA ligase [Clostridiales bacterium]